MSFIAKIKPGARGQDNWRRESRRQLCDRCHGEEYIDDNEFFREKFQIYTSGLPVLE
jgi:hypothetical protein